METSDGPDDPSAPNEQPPPPPDQAEHSDASLFGWELPEQFDFLRNRLLIAGLCALSVLLLTAIVLVILGGSSDDGGNASASANGTPDGTAVATANADFTARVLTTATMRIGPGLGYAIMGTVPEGAVVVVVGRNEDDTWLQIVYPPGSQLRGWAPIEQLELTGDIEELSVEGPAEGPDVPTDLPVYTPWTSTPAPFTPPPQNTRPPPPTRTPALATNTPPAPPTNTPGAPTNTPHGQGAVDR